MHGGRCFMENGQVVIRKRGADRIRRGHLWVYRSDVLDARDVQPGSIVTGREERRERDAIFGKAFYSSQSQIALRFLSRGDPAIDESFFRRRFRAASELRSRL